MEMTNYCTTALERVLVELAESRGIRGVEELVERANDAGAELTVEELLGRGGYWPRCGFGKDLDVVLRLDEEEKVRLVGAFVETCWPKSPSLWTTRTG
jgi:hypothetical protein